jgi:prevent-host-death family protein
MHSVSIRDARAHLADIIAQVGNGQAVVITRRGREVARIVPAAQAIRPLPNRAKTRAAMVKRGAKVTRSTVTVIRSEERW